MRPKDRVRIQAEVVSRVVSRELQRARLQGDGQLEAVINDTLYHERRRLEHEHGKGPATELAFYDQVQRRLRRTSREGQVALLELLAQRFVSEVVGSFDERVYRVATKVVPRGLWMLLNAMSPRRLLSRDVQNGLAEHLRIGGAVEHARRLVDRGTVIVVPTHLSNLDSPVIGYVAFLAGLPPLTYGAGLNLFTNPLLSYFMHHLGAYKVDRKKTAGLYKEVLKEYATVSMEMGYHNLFFPGGTRSRSGGVEQKLKLGLLGAGVRAFVANLRAHRERPRLYVVPATINYKLVLEAETLVDDYLKETGKSRYIIEDDEFSRPRRVAQFLQNLVSLESRIEIEFCRPLDPFGNDVDEEGRSVDAHGRTVDPSRYVLRDGEPVHDEQRDVEYTRELAASVVASFRRESVVMSTHLVAASLFGMLRRRNPGLDLYRLLRTGGEATSFAMAELHDEVERNLATLRERWARKGGPVLDDVLGRADPPEIVSDALKHFAIYHTRRAATRRGDRVFHEDRGLLLYYGNRVACYLLDATPGVSTTLDGALAPPAGRAGGRIEAPSGRAAASASPRPGMAAAAPASASAAMAAGGTASDPVPPPEVPEVHV